jgi:hypothetical protein
LFFGRHSGSRNTASGESGHGKEKGFGGPEKAGGSASIPSLATLYIESN